MGMEKKVDQGKKMINGEERCGRAKKWASRKEVHREGEQVVSHVAQRIEMQNKTNRAKEHGQIDFSYCGTT